MQDRKGMSPEDLLALAQDRFDNAASDYFGSDIWRDRVKAWDYYYGRPMGNEELGKSKVVSSDVYDAVESDLPGLIEVFAASDDAVRVTAALTLDDSHYAQAVEAAKQKNAFVQQVIWKQNDGFLNFVVLFKDGLLQKNGILHWYPEEITEVIEQSHQGLSGEQVQAMAAQEGTEIIGLEDVSQSVSDEFGNVVTQEAFNARVKTVRKRRKICITVVPPQEFIPDPNARSPRPALMDFCGMLSPKTLSDCRKMGYEVDDDIGDDAPWMENAAWDSALQDSRYNRILDNNDNGADPSMRVVWLRNIYMRVDFDGDGIAELRNIRYIGDKLLYNEIVSHVPFSCFTPNPLQHQFHGWSKADETISFQHLNTGLWRAAMDAIYKANDPRMLVGKNSGVELDDLLTDRPGGLVRATDISQIVPMPTPYQTPAMAFQGMEVADVRKEIHTGTTRYNQGLDSNSLNKTARGASLIFNASQQRQRLRARIAGEVCMKDLVHGLLKTWKDYGDTSMVVEVNGMRHRIDPSQWNDDYEVDINVGIGAADKEQMAATLEGVTQRQVMALQMGGKDIIVNLKNIYNTEKRKLEAAGLKSVDDYWMNPENAPPPQPQPNPEIEKAKIQANAEIEKAKIQQETEIEKKRMELDAKSMFVQPQMQPQQPGFQ